jgi:hypothetical protein
VEDAKGLENELDRVEGMQFDRGCMSPYVINNPDKQSPSSCVPARRSRRSRARTTSSKRA